MLEILAGPSLTQHADGFFQSSEAFLELEPGHLELFLAIAGSAHDTDSTFRHQVDGGQLFGESHRVVHDHESSRDVDTDPFGGGSYSGSQRDRCRHEPVVGPVMFGENNHVETGLIGPPNLFETGRVLA